ncbi:MAG: formate dehydrogenase accessory protein FdhE [Thermomicrobiales bacterium]|nr:formate dehydrogenase accessory protein FdhE [Thermomicrobiales bacterium]
MNRLPKLSRRGRDKAKPTTVAPSLPASAQRRLSELLATQPESAAWLALVEAVMREGRNPLWDTVANATMLAIDRAAGAPLLAGAQIPIGATGGVPLPSGEVKSSPQAEVNALQQTDAWIRRLMVLASHAGPDAPPLAHAAQSPSLDGRALLEAAVNADDELLAVMASDVGVATELLTVVADLAATPLLQALRGRLAPMADNGWRNGYCPVCGDWPHLAELRGLERTRHLRCARCGSDWVQPGVCCPFCAAAGQGTRAALVSEQDGEARKVETCTHCRGYLKVISTLRAWPGDEVCLADLATVDLDLAALERGYGQPESRGGLGVRVR